MNIHLKKGQNIIEAAVLLAIIISALMIMQFYIKRSYQGRIKEETDQIGKQYSPGHSTLDSTVTVHSHSQSVTGGSIVNRAGNAVGVADGVTVTIADTDTNTDRDETVDAFNREQ